MGRRNSPGGMLIAGFLMCFGLSVGFGWQLWSYHDLKERGSASVATVEQVRRKGKKTEVTVRFQVHGTPPHTHRAVLSGGMPASVRRRGQRAPVLYDPLDPSTARYHDDWWGYTYPLYFIGGGLLLFAVMGGGAFVMFQRTGRWW